MVLKLISNLFDLFSKLGLTHFGICSLSLHRSGLSLSSTSSYLLIHRITWRGHFFLRLIDIVFTKVVPDYRVTIMNQLVLETRCRHSARQVIWNHHNFFVLAIPPTNVFDISSDWPYHVRLQQINFTGALQVFIALTALVNWTSQRSNRLLVEDNMMVQIIDFSEARKNFFLSWMDG